VIGDENPFCAVAESEADPEPPCEIEIEVGLRVKEKSEVGGGGGPCVSLPPPQAQRNIPNEITRQGNGFLEGEHQERAKAVLITIGQVPSVNAKAQDCERP